METSFSSQGGPAGGGVHPVVDAIASVDAGLDKAVDAAVWGLSDDDLADSLHGCERVSGRVVELRARLVAEADGRDLGRRRGAASTRSWLRDTLRWRPGQAKWQVDAANRMAAAADAVDGPVDYGPNVGGPATGREMPATRAALAEGAISAEAVVVIARTMAKLPRHVTVDDGVRAEADLAAFARQFDPGTLGKLAAHLLHVLDTDTLGDDEGEQYRRRELRLDDQSGHIAGRLDTDGMATVRTALDVLARPQPAADGTPDPRSPGRRLADALVELARRALASDTFGSNHGVSHRVLLLAGLDTLAAGHDCTRHGEHPDDDHTSSDNDTTTARDDEDDRDDGDREADANVADPDAFDDLGAEGLGAEDLGAEDPGGVRSGTAGAAADGDASGPDAGNTGDAECPLAARRDAGGIPPGELVWGGPISAAAVRRITCTAGIQRVVVDPAGAVLDVGREQRTVTPAQYAALIARDGGCAHPGCTRPAAWCIAHHIIHWADGGKTDLDNLVLLCTYHHMSVHHRGWTVTMAADRLPEFTPPKWIDPDQQPRRNSRPRYHRSAKYSDRETRGP